MTEETLFQKLLDDGLNKREAVERIAKMFEQVDMAEVWRSYAEHIAPILAENRRARAESNNPMNSEYIYL